MFLIMPFILRHIVRFRCECCTVPSVSPLHISFTVFLDELLKKPEAVPAPLALLCLFSNVLSTLVHGVISIMMNHYFYSSPICVSVIGCWHFDKRQRSRFAGLPGGV